MTGQHSEVNFIAHLCIIVERHFTVLTLKFCIFIRMECVRDMPV